MQGLVARLLAKAALWVRIQTSLKRSLRVRQILPPITVVYVAFETTTIKKISVLLLVYSCLVIYSALPQFAILFSGKINSSLSGSTV